MRSLFATVVVTFSFLVSATASLHAQTPATAPVGQIVPSDPAELMKLAAQVNGLGSANGKPWHIKLSYQTFTPKGKLDDEGTLEEWWAAADKDKIVYAGTKFHRTVYIMPSGAYQTGDSGVLPPGLFFLRQAVLYPGMKPLQAAVVYRTGENPFKGPDLACVDAVLVRKGSKDFVTDKYCFRAGTAVLRAHVTAASIDTVYQGMRALGTQNIAEEITMRVQAKNHLTARLLKGDLLSADAGSEFDVPSDAVKVEASQLPEASEGVQIRKTTLSSPNFPKHLGTNFDAPAFPVQSYRSRRHLTVNLAALIGPDGRVMKIESLSEANAASEAAIEAVAKWTYGPTAPDRPFTETWLMIDVTFN